jgi:hypothetical protein
MRGSLLGRWFAGMAAAPLLIAGLAAGPQVASAATAACQPWSGAQPPKPPAGDTEGLDGVAVVSACDVWAVGGRDDGSGLNTIPMIDHWTGGSSWKRSLGAPVSPATPRGEESITLLNDVAAASATSVWAVGFWRNVDPLIEHWNGKGWSATIQPTTGPPQALNGVAAVSASNVWAVGSAGPSAGRALIEHWNGHGWSRVANPKPPRDVNSLNAVSARSATDIWAVGSGHDKGSIVHSTLIEHWDGHQWKVVPAPSPAAGGGSSLSAVSALSANNVWAVGRIGDDTPPLQPLIEHWNGTKWTRVTSPVTTTTPLTGVDAVSATSVWAVGTTLTGATSSGTVLHWNGTAWSARTMPGSDFLSSVAGPSGQVWTAGGRSQFDGAFAAPVTASVPAMRSR